MTRRLPIDPIKQLSRMLDRLGCSLGVGEQDLSYSECFETVTEIKVVRYKGDEVVIDAVKA